MCFPISLSCKNAKRICLISLAVIFSVSCSSRSYPVTELNSYPVDMSAYKGMSSTEHHFKGIYPEELFTLFEEKGSAVIYLGYSSCPNCQEAVKLINKAAEKKDITVYYLDAYNESHPLSPYVEEVEELLYDILPEKDGKRSIMVPFLFAVKGGIPSEHYCGLIPEYDGSEKTDQKMIKIYTDIMKDFKAAEPFIRSGMPIESRSTTYIDAVVRRRCHL